MNQENISDNNANGAGTCIGKCPSFGRCPVDEQRRPGRYSATANRRRERINWRPFNKVVMECYYESEPDRRGFMKRMKRNWDDRGLFEVSAQRLLDQVRVIKTNEYFSKVELEEIRRKVENRNNEEVQASEEQDSNLSEQRINTENVETSEEERPGQLEDENEPTQGETEIATSEFHILTDSELTEEQLEMIKIICELPKKKEKITNVSFRKVDRKKLREITSDVNKVLKYIMTNDVETNDLINDVAVYVNQRLGLKQRKDKVSQEPFWKRRIQRDINELRKTVGKLDRYAKGQIKNMKKLEQICKKHHVKKKGVKVVMEELKQRITAKGAKIDRYEKRINLFRINRMFSSNQKRVFVALNGEVIKENTVPNADESRKFWSEIWDNPVEHNDDAEWLRESETESKGVNKQDDVKITAQDVRKQTGKIPNWKAAGPDGIQGYWLKNLSSLHDRIACQLNAVVESGDVPAWLTYGRTVLCVKDRSKGNAASNFRPISCLPLMWKLLTGMLSEQLYKHVDTNDMLPSEQKGCRKETRGTKDQLLIDRMVLKNCKRRHTNLAMAYVDYKKSYDMIPHSWILKSLQLVGAADNIVNVLEKSMTKWKVHLNAGDKVLGDVNVKRGILQGDSLSSLLFVICLIPMSLILRKMKAGYSLGKNQPKLNHLLYMDDLKLFGQSERDIESLVNTVHRFSCDIGMRFGIEKCGVIVMKRGQMVTCDGIELPDGEKMKGVSEEGCKYLGIVELDGIKEKAMKEIFTKEYKRRIKLILK